MPTPDTLAVAATAPADMYSLALKVAPMLTPAGIVVLALAWGFRAEIKVWLTSRSFDRQALVRDLAALRADFTSLSTNLSTLSESFTRHADREESYWEKMDGLADRQTKVEKQMGEIQVSLDRGQAEVMRNLEAGTHRMDTISQDLSRLPATLIEMIKLSIRSTP